MPDKDRKMKCNMKYCNDKATRKIIIEGLEYHYCDVCANNVKLFLKGLLTPRDMYNIKMFGRKRKRVE